MGHVIPYIRKLLGHVNPNIGKLLGHVNPNIGGLLGHQKPFIGEIMWNSCHKIGFGITFPIGEIPKRNPLRTQK